MGGKPSQTTNTSANQSATNTPPAWLNPYYQNTVGRAQSIANTPYQPYTGQLVAPINQQQQEGIGTINQAAGAQLPYNAAAAGLAGASAQAINPTAMNGQAIGKFESPYQSQVIGATEAEIQNANQQQAASLTSNAAASGALGGDRAGVAQAQLAGQQAIANNQTLASLNNQNYSQALQEANTQQQLGLSAQQNTAARQAAAAGQYGSLGANAVSEGLAGGQAQANAGTLEQQTGQAQDTAAYNQYMQQLAYPFQTTGWLANIAEGIGSQAGGTSTGFSTGQQQLYNSNPWAQLGGLGLIGAGALLGRGGRIHRDSGGGLGGSVLSNGPTMPWYADPSMFGSSISPVTGAPAGPGGGSSVPGINLPIGHTMPTLQQGTPSSGGGGSGSGTAATSGLASLAGPLKSFGNAFANSSLGDTVQDAIQDLPDSLGFRRGGLAGARWAEDDDERDSAEEHRALRIKHGHFDAGGDVNPLVDIAGNVMANNLYSSAANGGLTAAESGMPAPQQPQGPGANMPAASLGPQLQPEAPEQPGTYPPSEQPQPTHGLTQLASAQSVIPGQTDPHKPGFDPNSVSFTDSSGLGAISAATHNEPASWPSIKEAQEFGEQEAAKYGIEPGRISALISKEYGGPSNPTGDKGSSFSPLQLHYAIPGATGAISHPGMGNDFTAATKGLFAGDPANWKSATAYAISQIPKTGWAPWTTSQHKLGWGAYEGIGGGGDGGTSALAFDNTGATESSAPGQKAISGALRGSGGLGAAAAPTGVTTTPDGGQFGWLDRTLGGGGAHSKGLLGIDMPDSVRAMMFQAGAGMMGAKTQNFGQALGEGLQSGIQGTRGMAMQNALMGLRGAQTTGVLTDAALKQMNLKMMFDYMNRMQSEGQQVGKNAEAAAAKPMTNMIAPVGSAGAAPATGIQSAGGASAPVIPASGAPGAAPVGSVGNTVATIQPSSGDQQALQIPNAGWPPWMHQEANRMRLINPTGANQIDERAKQIELTGVSYDVNGNAVRIPAYAQMAQQIAGQKAGAMAGAEAQAKLPFETENVRDPVTGAPYPMTKADILTRNSGVAQPGMPGANANLPQGGVTPGRVYSGLSPAAEGNIKALQAQDQGMQKSVPQIAQQLQRFDRIGKLMENFETGTFAGEKANFIGALKSVLPNVPTTATANPASYQEYMKDTIANAMTGVQQMGGGRVLLAEIMAFKAATAAPNLQPGANAAIIAQSKGILNQTKDFIPAFLEWHQAHPMASTTDAAQFEENWYKQPQNLLQNYVDSASKDIAYAGQVMPNSKNGVHPIVGQAYKHPTNGGIYRWDGKNFNFERQAGG